jgi:hypothetical protein
MTTKNDAAVHDDIVLINAFAHVVGRSGLAMAGAMCGTFVAAELAQINVWFDTSGFIAAMVAIGMIGFYLGVDIPLRVPDHFIARPRLDAVELLSAAGTFLAATAALVSIYSFVFDETPNRSFEYVLGSWWIFGVGMQIGAGLTGRLRLAGKAAAGC